MTKVLLAEDDEYLLAGLSLALQRKGYTVHTVCTGIDAKAAALTGNFDLLLLDLGLPGLDGIEVLRDLRSNGRDLPVIIITARDGIDERIHGLDLGANDYLVKPFDTRELEARMRAALRKNVWHNKTSIEFGPIRLNTNSGVLHLNEKQMDLTPKETMILKTLISQAGTVVSKRQLTAQASDWTDEVSENAIEIIVHRLRKKLEESAVLISTVRGFGYILEEKKLDESTQLH